MKKILSDDKLRGGYYTPEPIADFLVKWAIRSISDEVLEPSCGDGSFIRSVMKQRHNQRDKNGIIGIELDSCEAEKASIYGADIICTDFFSYYEKNIKDKRKFDAIIGNPPFIRSQNFDEDYRRIAFSLLEQEGLHPNRLTNIWIPFLVLSSCALKPNGRLGMVIPAEVMQVNYAAEIRGYLANAFESLTIVTFKKLLFPNAQQEVVLFLGEKTSKSRGIRTIEVEDAAELCTLRVEDDIYETKCLDHSKEKWTQYYLSNAEIALLRHLRTDTRISAAIDLFDVNVGIVSGENEFFLINRNTVEVFGLQENICPIIGRAEQLRGIHFTDADLDALGNAQRKVYFFCPQDVDFCSLSSAEKRYIEYGVANKYHMGYKCRNRKNWYAVPQSWFPDAFMLRQINKYPRIVLNDTPAQNTDTLHKIRFKPNVCPKTVASAFLNSFTFALSETIGRSYGGGVLTFEPGEVRKFLIPMLGADKLDFDLIDNYVRKQKIDSVLNYTDKILLQEGLGLSRDEVMQLRGIWDRLSERRIGRKKG